MLDRQKVEAILSRRFPGAGHDQVAAAANAIMGLTKEPDGVVRANPQKPRGPSRVAIAPGLKD